MKAVILVAGKGTRLHPLTLTRPKHLVPVGGKPIIDHILTALKNAGINEVVFIVNYMAERLQHHLGDGTKYGMKFEYAVQKQLNGTADATSFAEPFMKKDFLLTYGDWLTTSDAINAVLKIHRKEKPAATMAVVSVENPEHYGIVELENSFVKAIVEKPHRDEAPTNLANAGIYVLSTEIFEAIKHTEQSPRGELEITDSLSLLLEEGHKIAAAKLSSSEMFDVGLLWDLFEANRWVLEKTKPKKEGQIEDASHLISPITIEEGARIRSGTYIEGPVFIGKDSDIGPNCFIRPYTSIGQKVRIGNACEIKNSIIMDKTHIGHLSYIGDSIIGENCNFGAGTTIANYRLDGRSVKMKVKDKVLDTGRRKLGVVLGDDVKTGINALFMPGVKVGNNCWIGPNVVVYRDVPPNTIIMFKQEQGQRKKL
ncbi:MAG: sugar phosphate nucleotidyltransferase [Candidatus Bathyarchaeota archaeon]|nr:sugar phosphate nucleotidyltransferase [Candidatus Bathyarchaeota archaeon]MDH5494944.1 sugar phosphate nucleotidyltransferase [Candidatus Bathyarchaeota archaeon]